MPKVSVVIPLWSGVRTVARALQSVFAQTYADYEIVVVYDSSKSEAASVLAGYRDRIHMVDQPNRGLSTALNAGILASRGEYVAFLDDDDEWMPEKLARTVPVLDQDPDCALVYTGTLKVDPAGTPMPNQVSQTEGIDSPTLAQMLQCAWIIVPSQFMVRRAVLERCGGFDERLSACQDIYFLLTVREHGHFRYVPEVLVRKLTLPPYPKELEIEHRRIPLIRLVRERYGASAAGLIREFRRKRLKLMIHMAHVLTVQGRPKEARRCLARVIHYKPASLKHYRRYLKTFLPMRAPRAASRAEDSKA